MSESITIAFPLNDARVQVTIPATIVYLPGIDDSTPEDTPAVPTELITFYRQNLQWIADKMVDYWLPRWLEEAGDEFGAGHTGHIHYDGLGMLMAAWTTFDDTRYLDGAVLLHERWVHPNVTRTATTGVAGYHNYDIGMVEMALGETPISAESRAKAKESARHYAMFSAFSNPRDPLRNQWPYTAKEARELALGAISHMQYSRLEPSQASNDYINSALTGLIDVHITQWLHVLGENDPDEMSSLENNVAPFMFAHVARALITNVEQWAAKFVPFARDLVAESLSRLADAAYPLLWRTHKPLNGLLRDSRGSGFLYRPGKANEDEPTPDLALFIFPWFAWLYKETGREVYKNIAEQLFESGVRHAYIYNFKQANQHALWSRDGTKWMGWMAGD